MDTKRRKVETDLLTPQEIWIIGGTPQYRIKKDNEWYIPEGVLFNRLTFGEVSQKREELVSIITDLFGKLLGLPESGIAVHLKALDPVTSETKQDPTILGVVNKEGVIDTQEGESLTKKLYELYEKAGVNLHLRDKSFVLQEGNPRKEI